MVSGSPGFNPGSGSGSGSLGVSSWMTSVPLKLVMTPLSATSRSSTGPLTPGAMMRFPSILMSWRMTPSSALTMAVPVTSSLYSPLSCQRRETRLLRMFTTSARVMGSLGRSSPLSPMSLSQPFFSMVTR